MRVDLVGVDLVGVDLKALNPPNVHLTSFYEGVLPCHCVSCD